MSPLLPVWAAGFSSLLLPLLPLLPSAPLPQEAPPCAPGATRLLAQTPPPLAQLGVPAAWRLSRGEGVTVAVVGSGVARGNPHLAGQAVLPGIDLLDGGAGRTDHGGQGTALAGIIAARRVADSGVVGVAPAARILPVRVYDSAADEAVRAGRGPTVARTIEGIAWAAEHGARIILVSESTPLDSEPLHRAVRQARGRGALVVAPAGDAAEQGDRTARYPAAYQEALSVTAVGADGKSSAAVVHGAHVELAAPGSQVVSTYLGKGDCLTDSQSPSSEFAAAYAAGAAALVAAAFPDETPADWEYRLLATALRPSVAYRDAWLGWGLVAPHDALNLVSGGGLPGPTNPRVPAPATIAPPAMPQPPGTVEAFPGGSWWLWAMAASSLALFVGGLLLRRLRPPS